MTASDVCNTVA